MDRYAMERVAGYSRPVYVIRDRETGLVFSSQIPGQEWTDDETDWFLMSETVARFILDSLK